MNKFRKAILSFCSSLAALALTVGVTSASAACFFWFNQPETPSEIEKYLKKD